MYARIAFNSFAAKYLPGLGHPYEPAQDVQEQVDAPGALAVAEAKVLQRCACELVLQALALGAPHEREAERVKCIRVLEIGVVVVQRICSYAYPRSLRDPCPVSQRDVLHSLARHRDCVYVCIARHTAKLAVCSARMEIDICSYEGRRR